MTSFPGPSLAQMPPLDLASFESALEICTRVVCETTGWPLGHALMADAQRHRLVSTGIWRVPDADEFREWREARAVESFAIDQGLPGLIWRRGGAGSLPEDCDAVESALASRGAAPARAFGVPVMCGQELVAVLEFFHRDAAADDRLVRLTGSCLSALLGKLATWATLAADRAHLAAIIEATDDAVIATDHAGIILSWNAGAERLYGYTREEAVGESLRLVVPPEPNTSTPVLTRVLRDARRLEQFETVRRRKNGQLVDVALTASPVFDHEGRVRGASSIERDITRRKRFEAECASAQAEAECANRAKSEFLANVSHELRTPMNAILGMLELSLDERLPPTVHDYLSTAHDSAQVLLFLLKDLLDFSRTEAGTFELEWSPFQLRKTIRHATRTLAVRAHEKGLELLCRIHANVPDELDGDARRVQQIIMNLLGNAIKFTDSGEVVVDVTLHSEQSDAVELLILVSDTGIGISTADQQRIFSPFTQVDATSTRKYSGTGLGLTITRELVNRMSGRLWVESDLGRGSRFFCTLQLKRAPVTSTTRQVEDGRAGNGSTHRPITTTTHPLRVLVAEDTPANQKVVSAILGKRGHSVTIVENGHEAVTHLQKDAFDVVLMDAQMPTMNGLQAAAAIRHIPNAERARVPIIAMTAHAMREDREKCLAAGMNDYLPKPVDAAELIQIVEKYGGKRAMHDENAETRPTQTDGTPSPAHVSSFDLQATLERFGGNREIAWQFLRLFREESQKQTALIRAALDDNDSTAAARAAHNLRGVALYLDAAPLAAAASAVEAAADDGDDAAAHAGRDRLQAELDRLLAALDMVELSEAAPSDGPAAQKKLAEDLGE